MKWETKYNNHVWYDDINTVFKPLIKYIISQRQLVSLWEEDFQFSLIFSEKTELCIMILDFELFFFKINYDSSTL